MIYLFGDSFTHCAGCTPNDEYYEKTYDGTQKTWVDLLAEHLNIDSTQVYNRGRGGVGNQFIIESFVESLHNIKDNALVVIGRADDWRFQVPYENGYKHIISQELETEKGEYWDAIRTYSQFLHTPYEDIIVDRFDTLYEGIYKYLDFRGIKYIKWSVSEHLLDETGKPVHPIIQDECPEINDGHWSWKGHQSFFEYIKTLL